MKRKLIRKKQLREKPQTFNKACENCMFFKETQYHNVGECRRHAPTLAKQMGDPSGYDVSFQSMPQRRFIAVYRNDWCGDFKFRGEK